MKETTPLAWPEGWIRTLLKDRQSKAAWKKPLSFYRDQLEKELDRRDVVSAVLTRNEKTLESRDPGVAVYFQRKAEQDFSWQDILNIHEPDPSIETIDMAFRRLSAKYHPDNKSTGDIHMFLPLDEARKKARKWAEHREGSGAEYVVACDRFNEQRLNINAVRITLNSIRRIEEVGSSSLLERAFKGFAALPENVPAREIVNAKA